MWLARGRIFNDRSKRTGEANPHHDNPMIGPNIHTVCKYMIAPVTRLEGGMSWALALHPEGIPVDFFVTHSWSEGIFEFGLKVLESWPPGAPNMWCCFLANPQSWGREHLKL